MGCLIDLLSPRLIALSCSPDLAEPVAGRLAQFQEEGILDYESGRSTDGSAG